MLGRERQHPRGGERERGCLAVLRSASLLASARGTPSRSPLVRSPRPIQSSFNYLSNPPHHHHYLLWALLIESSIHYNTMVLQVPPLYHIVVHTALSMNLLFMDHPIIRVKFPRTGKMVKMWHFFYIFWSSAVTKQFDFFNFFQLFWINFARWILKMFSFWS